MYWMFLYFCRLAGTNFSEQSCELMAAVFQSANSHLKELDLGCNTDIKDSGVKLLCTGLISIHCKIEKLRLMYFVNNRFIKYILKEVKVTLQTEIFSVTLQLGQMWPEPWIMWSLKNCSPVTQLMLEKAGSRLQQARRLRCATALRWTNTSKL